MKRTPGKAKPAVAKQRPAPPPAGQTDGDRAEDRAVDEIVRRGPSGAFALAGVATAIVVAMYFAFYLFIYLPRGAVQ